ncbi:Uncharacterized protein TCM_010859 [Theobroma cacao]|uniref:Hydroxyproline-rich glycoprotein family protein n=1 Tax=Theobroma cacao TaxID=3641 RepID=A0A061E8H1_THECC|nr:Uncharacterized protein TCM_010859 [Theobroma cacao]
MQNIRNVNIDFKFSITLITLLFRFKRLELREQTYASEILLNTAPYQVATVAYPISSLESRKLDESIAPGDPGVKCNPSCIPSPPPPSPPPPSPPPPCPPPPELPPPTPKKPPTKYCPPPPSPPSFIYITGPPGSLYPVDQDFGGASRNLEVGLLGLVCGFLILVAF